MAVLVTFQGLVGTSTANQSLAANTTSSGFILDATASGILYAELFYDMTAGGTVQAAATTVVTVTKWNGTIYLPTGITYTLTTPVASASASLADAVPLSPGKYTITIKNTDTANAITFNLRYATVAQ